MNRNQLSKSLLVQASIFVLLLTLSLPAPSAAAPAARDSTEAADSGLERREPAKQPSTSTSEDSELSAEAVPETHNLANLEALLNIAANGLEIAGFAFGFCLFWTGVILLFKKKVQTGVILMVIAPVITTVGVAVPGLINWLVASARDANLFS